MYASTWREREREIQRCWRMRIVECVQTYTYTHTHTYTRIHTRIYARVHTRTRIHTNINSNTNIDIKHTCTIHAYMHTCKHDLFEEAVILDTYNYIHRYHIVLVLYYYIVV